MNERLFFMFYCSCVWKHLGKPDGKPVGKRPFKPHNSDKKKPFTKPGGKAGPKKFFKQKPTEGKMTKKRKLSDDHNNTDEGMESPPPPLNKNYCNSGYWLSKFWWMCVVVLNSAGSEAKKPKWNEFKQKKKDLKQNRQQNERKETYHIVNRAKQVWGIARRWAVFWYIVPLLYICVAVVCFTFST